ncbi:MAG: PEP-CTERM sorting domain-containing protein [Verrucomicrobiota bacterium]
MKPYFFSLTAATAVVFLNPAAHGLSEIGFGDFSGDFSAPTVIPFPLAPVTVDVTGQIGNNGDTGATNGNDADYFTVEIPQGLSVVSIFVEDYTFSPGNPNVSFLGFVSGSSFGGQTAGDIDGSVLVNASSGEILDNLLGGSGELSAGNYSFWLQETSANVVDYRISFTTVPEPSTYGALFGAVCLLGAFLIRGRR